MDVENNNLVADGEITPQDSTNPNEKDINVENYTLYGEDGKRNLHEDENNHKNYTFNDKEDAEELKYDKDIIVENYTLYGEDEEIDDDEKDIL